MRIQDWIKEKILNYIGVQELQGNPNQERFTLYSSTDELRAARTKEYFTWYRGDSDDILDFFTGAEWSDFQKSPIYNRNKRDYFWVASAKEKNIKRSHSGIPRAIVDTLVNAIGAADITVEEQYQQILDEIIEENSMNDVINQQQIPYTLVGGWGAYKIDVDTDISENPIITFYTADNVDFIYNKKRLIGIIFKDFFEKNGKRYVMFETRAVKKGNSYITYDLYEIGRSDELFDCDKSVFPELGTLEDKVITGLKMPLAVPCIFFDEVDKDGYGRSIYTGKTDLFDDLDQCISQAANTVRKSTPVEYYPADMLERTKAGTIKMPERFDRTFLPSPLAAMTGDGQTSGELKTTQPNLNFNQYSDEEHTILGFILTGVLSPATMGIDIAKKDNADAQREKEKITVMTRNNIIARQTKILETVYKLALFMKTYIQNPDLITVKDFDVSVSFGEFANPSFENQLSTLGSALNGGIISPEKFIDLLWGDTLSEQEKMVELLYIQKQRQGEQAMVDEMGMNPAKDPNEAMLQELDEGDGLDE
jgi:hypothetical protein